MAYSQRRFPSELQRLLVDELDFHCYQGVARGLVAATAGANGGASNSVNDNSLKTLWGAETLKLLSICELGYSHRRSSPRGRTARVLQRLQLLTRLMDEHENTPGDAAYGLDRPS